MDLKKWECGVPGKEKTIWEGGLFKLEVSFPDGEFEKPPIFSVVLEGETSQLTDGKTRIPHQATQM